jgi:hypothetical protein
VKWQRPVIIAVVAICSLLLCHQVALAVSTTYKDWVPAWLGGMNDEVSVDITATPVLPGYVGPPVDFTATYISDNCVRLDWTMGIYAENTTIRAKFWEYPNDNADGYLVFDGSGTTSNDTALHFDVLLGTVYYRAWSENATGSYSVEYADAELENPHVITIASVFNQLPLLLMLAGIVGLAYWHRDRLLYILAGFGFLIFGFDYWTTNYWLSIIIVLAGIYSFMKAGMARGTKEARHED